MIFRLPAQIDTLRFHALFYKHSHFYLSLYSGGTMAQAIIEPYLFFGGRCEEAIEFYRQALGAEVEMVMLFKDSPQPMPPGVLQPGFENKVMHASFNVAGQRLMASDGCNDDAGFKGFSLSLGLPGIVEVEKAFSALAEGGKVNMALAATFWSPMYGMLTDRFGISWMITLIDEQQAK
jgi:PhnB protein